MVSPQVRALALIVGFGVFAGVTAARGDLGQEPSITEGLIGVAIAYEVGEQCDSISARRLAGVNYLFQLKDAAADLGYSSAEIDAFVDNRAEQDRLEQIARQRLRDLGAVEGQPGTYCDVGRAQMAQGTIAGQLLR